MSGLHTFIDTPRQNNRRWFLKQVLALVGVSFAGRYLAGCADVGRDRPIQGGIVGSGSSIGHMIRDGKAFPPPSQEVRTGILIIGGGISGLSAARWLQKKGAENVIMVEMGDETGGNSIFGQNKVSAYPWAAHYLPIPDVANTTLIEFLTEIGVITGFTDGVPAYNEYHLCHDPEERLYIDGYWQEGLIPKFGITREDEAQIARFMKQAEDHRSAKGNDGKFAFCIPLDASSADEEYRKLDRISFRQFLNDNGYTSKPLLWYLEYCCKDDYGSGLDSTSAWAGMHYFASRRGKATNASSSAVLTWPEGNGYLMSALRKHNTYPVRTGLAAFSVANTDTGVSVDCYDGGKKSTVRIVADKVLLCTPQHVNKYLLKQVNAERSIYDKVHYAPWVVANVTCDGVPEGKGTALCWDNVVYGRQSVGYVFANHQNLVRKNEGVLTWYLPFTEGSPKDARKAIYNKTIEDWKKLVLEDLAYAHPGIEAFVTRIDVKVWGHGMIQPVPGYVWGADRTEAMRAIDGRIFFAHSDLSGISIFEEAFSQGIRAAEEMLAG
ncbi:MAG: FAD-dependent oxidoreductase [Flavipsychrobacter sp.]|nr:FAD-dependent oxidoreductase [Flavipsychrobacter sp.]